VVHRDLKPENIFVLSGRPLAIKVLDFGIAKLLDPDEFLNLTATGVAIGTPMFIAPEQAMGDKHNISPQTDLYSLGVVLYAMLCGVPPFQSEGIGSLLVMHINEPPPPLLGRAPHLPGEIAELVHRCLEKDPARRPRSAAAVARDFELALGAADPTVEAPLSFQPRSTVPDAADPEEGRATMVDPRYQGDLHRGPTYLDPSPPPAHVQPAAVTFKDAVSPSVLLGQPRPERPGLSTAHLVALGGAVVGLALIVALVVVAIRLMGR
jgi:serine/threonine protein kinase